MIIARELAPDNAEAVVEADFDALDSLPGEHPEPSASPRADELRAQASRARDVATELRGHLRPLPQLPAA